jgi:diaminopimelate epimerase
MIKFYKYHGAGNDLIVIDNREEVFDPENKELIQKMCHRRFGIGADGIMLLWKHPEYEFEMQYINSDGSSGLMCGNGARCLVHFAHHVLGIIKDPENIKFWAVNGEYEAKIIGDKISVKMQDIEEIGFQNEMPFLRSGTTPHHIKYVTDLDGYPVVEETRKMRENCGDPKGININYVEKKGDDLYVRIYERGIEDETWACGTGAVCSVVASHKEGIITENNCKVKQPGGWLEISFEEEDGIYRNIWLTGEAEKVFKGEIE